MAVAAPFECFLAVNVTSAVVVESGGQTKIRNSAHASIAVRPKSGALAAGRRVPFQKVGRGNAISIGNIVTEIALLNKIELGAVIDHVRLHR